MMKYTLSVGASKPLLYDYHHWVTLYRQWSAASSRFWANAGAESVIWPSAATVLFHQPWGPQIIRRLPWGGLMQCDIVILHEYLIDPIQIHLTSVKHSLASVCHLVHRPRFHPLNGTLVISLARYVSEWEKIFGLIKFVVLLFSCCDCPEICHKKLNFVPIKYVRNQ